MPTRRPAPFMSEGGGKLVGEKGKPDKGFREHCQKRESIPD